ncbi:armadillo-type protein [Mycena latifolia]|nr:armadillo-type protein [Mycena latifolia]
MHPITRQPTLDSVRSWWSDRNPLGPNINLHATAKPLMRVMYHRAALALIRNKRGTPLSRETAEVYSSYLAFKYVSSDTKIAILRELCDRAELLNDADIVVYSPVLYLIDGLLQLPETEIRVATCRLLTCLASHKSTATALLDLNPCLRLVALLRDRNPRVIERALQVLGRIITSPNGAQAVVDANVLNSLAEVLESPHEEVLGGMWELLGRLACQESTVMTVLQKLVSLMRVGNPKVLDRVEEVLHQIIMSSKGAQVLDSVAELLDSPGNASVVRIWVCQWLAKLPRQENTRDIVSRVKPCLWLVSLLRDENIEVVHSAAHALYSIAGLPNGAQAVVDANVLDCVPKLLESSGALIWSWIYDMLEQMAYRQSTAMTVIRLLVSLLHGENLTVIECVTKLLCRITTSPKGAQIAMDANVLTCAVELLASPSAMVWRWTCELLEQLANERTTVAAVVSHLVFLLCHRNPIIVESVVMILYRIAWLTAGAQAALEADVLHCVGELLHSPNPEVRQWTCKMLALLTPHVVSLLRNGNFGVIQAATYELDGLANFAEGAQAIVTAQILDYARELLSCPDVLVRKRTCQMLGKIARCKSMTAAILEVNPCHQLIFLLRDKYLEVVESAVYALLWIAKSPEGAQAIVEADAVAALVHLANTVALDHRCAAKILGHLAYHKATRLAILPMKPCKQLVSLLCENVSEVVLDTICALYWIARSPEGAQAVVDARVLEPMAQLLESTNTNVRSWTWSMLGRLARHKSTAMAILTIIPCCRLISLLRGGNLTVTERVAKVLHRIARSPEGAQAVLEADILVHAGDLLTSPSAVVRRWMCATLGELAWHESTRDAVLRINPSRRLVCLLRDETLEERAAYALSGLSRFPEGAEAAMEAKILDVAELLASQDTLDREEACCILTLLASKDPSMAALVRVKLCRMLVSLLRDENLDVVEQALHGLCYIIAKSSRGAQAVVDANVLDCIADLLESPSTLARSWTCAILHQLSSDETTATAVLDRNPCEKLFSLCLHSDLDLCASALFALEKISESRAGAAIVAATDIMGHVPELLQSPDREARSRTRKLLRNLARLQVPIEVA